MGDIFGGSVGEILGEEFPQEQELEVILSLQQQAKSRIKHVRCLLKSYRINIRVQRLERSHIEGSSSLDGNRVESNQHMNTKTQHQSTNDE